MSVKCGLLLHDFSSAARNVGVNPDKSHSINTKNSDEVCCAAEHAVDKDLSTRAATLIDSDGEAWLKLQFDKSNFIGKIIIYYGFYTNWYFEVDMEDYIKWIDNRNNVDVSVYQGDVKQKSCGTLQLTHGLEQSDQIYTLICDTKGDTVKLSKSENRILVYEIVVLSSPGIVHVNQNKLMI